MWPCLLAGCRGVPRMTERFALPVGTWLDGAMVSASVDRTAESWVFPGSRLLHTYRPSDPTKRLPSRAPLFPKRLRLSLKRVFYHLDLNQVGFAGDIVGSARNDREDVAGLGL